jgi:glycosyltransferase involved in cell wall biosynthesis
MFAKESASAKGMVLADKPRPAAASKIADASANQPAEVAESSLTISVIMPIYNGVQHVPESIASVVSQTLQPTEFLIVDDGSTDGSRELAESIDTSFPKYVFRQQNKRQSAARNLAASKAVGKYLAFIDHDDIWYPQHLERLIGLLEADQRLGWAYSDIDEIDAGGGLIRLRVLRSLNPIVEHPKTSIFNMLAADMFIFPSAAVVRRDGFLAIGGFDERLSGYEDDDLFLRMFRAGWLNAFDPEATIRYRRHPTSSAFSERMSISREIYSRKLIEGYPDDPELVRFYIRDLIAPRFYGEALAEYFRHYPHRRWKQCAMSVELMQRFTKLMQVPYIVPRIRRFVGLQILAYPWLFRLLYPVLRRYRPWPRLH